MTLLGSCSKEEEVSSPCARDEFAGCGLTCGTADICQVGMYCGSDSTCTAQCTAASAADDCGRNQVCSSDGHCMADPNATLPDGGKRDGGSTGGGDGDGGTGNCGFITLQTAPITPNVILIIDQSSSMDEKFGSGTRWTSLRDSLLSDTGLIKELEHVVRFGATFYSAREKEMPCPMLTEVQVAIDNFENIKAKYPGRTIAETPTGDSIEAVLKKLPQASPDDRPVPTIFILATDGEPDRCEELNPQKGQQEALDSVKHAFSLGIRTYIIGVGEEVSDAHMQEMANTGVGLASGSAPKWRANDDKGLRDALRTIVGGEVGCKVPLKGTVTGGECAGTIKINGKAVACSPTEGYQIAGGSAVQLNGTACDAIKKGEVLSAMFECDEAIPLF
jgi:hypothetical protein